MGAHGLAGNAARTGRCGSRRVVDSVTVTPEQLLAAARVIESGLNMAPVELSVTGAILTVSQGDERDLIKPDGMSAEEF